MNFDRSIKNLQGDADRIIRAISDLTANHDKAKIFTAKFLDECQKSGITKVSIGRKHKSIPNTLTYPFGHEGSVFAYSPKANKRPNESPAIWGVVNRIGISAGCGNGDQHQVKSKELIDGVYHLKNGNWAKVKE